MGIKGYVKGLEIDSVKFNVSGKIFELNGDQVTCLGKYDELRSKGEGLSNVNLINFAEDFSKYDIPFEAERKLRFEMDSVEPVYSYNFVKICKDLCAYANGKREGFGNDSYNYKSFLRNNSVYFINEEGESSLFPRNVLEFALNKYYNKDMPECFNITVDIPVVHYDRKAGCNYCKVDSFNTCEIAAKFDKVLAKAFDNNEKCPDRYDLEAAFTGYLALLDKDLVAKDGYSCRALEEIFRNNACNMLLNESLHDLGDSRFDLARKASYLYSPYLDIDYDKIPKGVTLGFSVDFVKKAVTLCTDSVLVMIDDDRYTRKTGEPIVEVYGEDWPGMVKNSEIIYCRNSRKIGRFDIDNIFKRLLASERATRFEDYVSVSKDSKELCNDIFGVWYKEKESNFRFVDFEYFAGMSAKLAIELKALELIKINREKFALDDKKNLFVGFDMVKAVKAVLGDKRFKYKPESLLKATNEILKNDMGSSRIIRLADIVENIPKLVNKENVKIEPEKVKDIKRKDQNTRD